MENKVLWIILIFTIGVIGVSLVTFLWSSFLHSKVTLLRSADDKEAPAERVWWIPALIGILERSMVITLVGWDVAGAAGFIGTWIAVKAVGGWQVWSRGSKYGRATFGVGLLGSVASLLFAVVGGLIVRWLLHRPQ